MARRKKPRWLCCPDTVPDIPSPELWRRARTPGWLIAPANADTDYTGALIGPLCPDGTDGHDGLIRPTRAAVMKWLRNGGDMSEIERMAARLGYDWSGLVPHRKKIVLSLPDGSGVMCPFSERISGDIEKLPAWMKEAIFRGYENKVSVGQARDVLRMVANAYAKKAHEDGRNGHIASALSAIVRDLVKDNRNNIRWSRQAQGAAGMAALLPPASSTRSS